MADGVPGGPDGGREERFELEQFSWASPDVVRISGRFLDVSTPPTADPVLVVWADQEVRAAQRRMHGSFADRQRWRLDFRWTEPPIPFTAATLVFGDELRVALPSPDNRRRWFGARVLDVERLAPALGKEAAPTGPKAVGLEADLVAQREEVRALQRRLDHANEELARTRADLDAERRGREEDAASFKDGLMRVRTSAEEQVAASQVDRDALTAAEQQLAAAHAARDDALARTAEAEQRLAVLTGEHERLAASLAAADQQLSEAKEARDGALQRLAEAQDELGRSRPELERLTAALQEARAAADAAEAVTAERDELLSRVAALEDVEGVLAESRRDAQQLLDRLTVVEPSKRFAR